MEDPEVDAVHLVVPPALHAPMTVQALEAGKHFMFMETSVYTREYLYVKELYESGQMGRIQYMNCAHYQHLLPKEIQRFTKRTVYDESNPHLAFLQGGGHGGSHPHLVNEFVQCIMEDRTPFPSDIDGAYWTAVDLLAHESAMEGGTVKEVPAFEEM